MLNSATNILLFKWETLKSTLMLIKSTGQNWPNYEKVWRVFFQSMQVALGINLHFKELGMMESISDLSLSGLSSQMMSAGGKKKLRF